MTTAIAPSTTEIQSLVQFPPAGGGANALVVKTGGQINIESGGSLFINGVDVTNNVGAAAVAVTGNSAELNNGTITAGGVLTYNPTAAGTVTLAPTIGIKDVVVNMPAAGAAMTFAVAAEAAYQEWKLHIKQGATVSTLTLNSGFVFFPSGGPISFTLTPTPAVRDVLWVESLDGTHVSIGAVLQGSTI